MARLGIHWFFFCFFCRHNTRGLCICGSTKIILITILIKNCRNKRIQPKPSAESHRSCEEKKSVKKQHFCRNENGMFRFPYQVFLCIDFFMVNNVFGVATRMSHKIWCCSWHFETIGCQLSVEKPNKLTSNAY